MGLNFEIEILAYRTDIVEELADLIIEVVANGGSVSFMHPLSKKTAMSFWETSLASADRGERDCVGCQRKRETDFHSYPVAELSGESTPSCRDRETHDEG